MEFVRHVQEDIIVAKSMEQNSHYLVHVAINVQWDQVLLHLVLMGHINLKMLLRIVLIAQLVIIVK